MNRLRDALGAFVTGVTVITARARSGDGMVGITANSFNSVSLKPPLVLVSLAKSLRSLPDLFEAPTFAINLLCERHSDLSRRFATSGGDKWVGVETETGVEGTPLLQDRLVGEVVDYALVREEEPLVFFRGAYRKLLTERRAG
jgi:flavin reductase (DIM6/NTAB) family NADH-FMN oxidoreductase RutF